jgi:Zn-dependent alcohol dehydrogenase
MQKVTSVTSIIGSLSLRITTPQPRGRTYKRALFSRFFGQSSLARQTVVHRSSLVKVRSDTDLALFPPLGYGLQTAAGAILNTLNMQAGKTVAIFGLVGMSVPYWIKPGT